MCVMLSLHLLTECLYCLRVSFDHAKCVRLMEERKNREGRREKVRGWKISKVESLMTLNDSCP